MDRYFLIMGILTTVFLGLGLILYAIIGTTEWLSRKRDSKIIREAQLKHLRDRIDSIWRQIERMQQSANEQATLFNSRLMKLEEKSKKGARHG